MIIDDDVGSINDDFDSGFWYFLYEGVFVGMITWVY
jgi:hypothetical protein